MKSPLIAALLICALPTPASARSWLDREADRHYTPTFSSCIDNSGGVTRALHACHNTELMRQDRKLNRIYREVMSRISSGPRMRLRDSERAWIRKRDIHCNNQGVRADGWGSLAGLLTHGCIIRTTIRRAILLERYSAGKATLADLARDVPWERPIPMPENPHLS